MTHLLCFGHAHRRRRMTRPPMWVSVGANVGMCDELQRRPCSARACLFFRESPGAQTFSIHLPWLGRERKLGFPTCLPVGTHVVGGPPEIFGDYVGFPRSFAACCGSQDCILPLDLWWIGGIRLRLEGSGAVSCSRTVRVFFEFVFDPRTKQRARNECMATFRRPLRRGSTHQT